jgi:hypothetical protein
LMWLGTGISMGAKEAMAGRHSVLSDSGVGKITRPPSTSAALRSGRSRRFTTAGGRSLAG